MTESRYIGRFAPSPTGQLHMGSLCAALASFLDAKSNNGLWLLRIEDIDPPREQLGASESIIESLQKHHLFWDNSTLFQSSRLNDYQGTLDTLTQLGLVYPCSCSRQDLQTLNGIHPKTCVTPFNANNPFATRIKVSKQNFSFFDRIQGQQNTCLADEGDFIVKRKEGFFSYQLAVVVDDAFQGITHVVRGIDLMPTTYGQIFLQEQLGLSHPHYLHIPVLCDKNNNKLSKQTFAQPINNQHPADNLRLALHYLQQPSPPATDNISLILQWAIKNWSYTPLLQQTAITL